MTFTVKSLQEAVGDMDVFYTDIDRILLTKGATSSIREALENKVAMAGKGHLDGIVLYHLSQPVAMGWVERVTQYYGNMVLHALYGGAKRALVEQFVSRGFLKDVFAELIQFEDDLEVYQEALLTLGIHQNHRQRMILDFARMDPLPERVLEDGIGFSQLTQNDIKQSSTISYFAHQVSQDYAGYKDLESVQNRIVLEQRVFDELYGPVISDASLFILHNNTVVGYCLLVEISCWGLDKVPWFFDVCIRPDFHGKGYGRKLMNEVLYRLQKMDYSVMGLSVTLSNVAAIGLYESLGFELAEYFFEFVELSSPPQP